MASRRRLSSFFSLYTWHLFMHCKGVIGAQFLHSESSDFSTPERSRLFSAFRINDRTLTIVYSPMRVYATMGKE
jgi:hypothetical protein